LIFAAGVLVYKKLLNKMDIELILSEDNILLRSNLLAKAKKICELPSSIPEVDIAQLVKTEIPEINKFLQKEENIDLELIVVARSVVRESMKYYLELVELKKDIPQKKTYSTTAVSSKRPSLDYYDNARDVECHYRTKYGKWPHDDSKPIS
jgi:hypothetical protein